MAQDSFRGKPPPPHEVLSDGQFHVEILQPQRLGQLIDSYAGTIQQLRRTKSGAPDVIGLARTTPNKGLFSAFNVNLLFPENPQQGFTMDLIAEYRNPQIMHWSSDELEQLKQKLTVLEGNDRVSLDIPGEDERLLIINHPVSRVTVTVFFGVPTQPQEHEGVTLRHEGNVTHINFGSTEEEAPILFMTLHGLGVGEGYDFSSPLLLAKTDPNGFIMKMTKWAQVMEGVINSAAQIKGAPQSGTLYLPDPKLFR